MKKFSRISALGLTAAAAFAIVACSPPGEVDSDVKIDNASTFENQSSPSSSAESTSAEPSATDAAAAGEQAQFIDCVAAPVTEPTSISLDTTNSDMVTEITWESWEAETAEGTGTRGEDEVAVVLSQPTQTESGLAFTQIEVDGEVVTP